MNEKVSVVIPVYNVKEYLNTCMVSVINQTYLNLEIIIIDDGSTDGSEKICDMWGEKDSRITVIHQNNAGLSAARNAGIKIAQGKYITFIDSDDYIELDMIEYLYQMLSEGGGQISICQAKNVDENGEPLLTKDILFEGTIQGNCNCMEHFFKNEAINTVAWGKMYQKELFHDIEYPVGKYHEDVFTTYKLIAKCDSIVVGPKKKYNYRWRTSGISKISFSDKHLHAIEGSIERSCFIKKHFPGLEYLANAGIVYATNVCALRYMKSDINDTNVVKYLQSQYRKYEKDFLKGVSGVKAKIFSIFAYINLNTLIKVYRILKNNIRIENNE